MLRTILHRLRFALPATGAAALVLVAVGGAANGGNFILGQANTATATTLLSGNPGANPLLRVTGTGTAATLRADAGSGVAINGISTSGTGQSGQSTSGYGLSGFHIGATGSSSGVFGQTASTDPGSAGVTGRNTAGGPGLQAIVTSNSVAPLKINSTAKVTSLNADLLDGINSTGFWKLGGNAGTTPGADFLGTTDNKALELKVNGQRALRIEPNSTSPNLVGGSSDNAVDDGAYGATIAGGGCSGCGNTVSDNFGTIGGGFGNSAGDANTDTTTARFATVSGGGINTASGIGATVSGGSSDTASGTSSTVGGGASNTASGNDSAVAGGDGNTAAGLESAVAGGHSNAATGTYSALGGGYSNGAGGHAAAVGGGESNAASNDDSTIAGGYHNTASNFDSTVAGGANNTASGIGSFAAGGEANASDTGSFVWGDSSGNPLGSNGANTVSFGASGGARFVTAYTNESPSAGVTLASGGGSWASLSDRAAKRDLAPVVRRALLQRLARIPISSWSYKSQQPSIRHLGPMAQDFYSAFGLGEDRKHIDSIDSEGVALAAIQGLYRQNQTLNGKVAGLQRQNRALSTRLTRLERAVAKLTR